MTEGRLTRRKTSIPRSLSRESGWRLPWGSNRSSPVKAHTTTTTSNWLYPIQCHSIQSNNQSEPPNIWIGSVWIEQHQSGHSRLFLKSIHLQQRSYFTMQRKQQKSMQFMPMPALSPLPPAKQVQQWSGWTHLDVYLLTQWINSAFLSTLG